jgi:hypothetical protein
LIPAITPQDGEDGKLFLGYENPALLARKRSMHVLRVKSVGSVYIALKMRVTVDISRL